MESVTIPLHAVNRLLGAANADAALLYIYLKAGNELNEDTPTRLNMSRLQLNCAAALLRQLGLHNEEKKIHIPTGERPNYSEQDVLAADREDRSFRSLCGEVQMQLGKTLNTEEMKILLGFVRYLGMPAEVISALIGYCKDRARQQGKLRAPSLRSIEKEAYAWADCGIDTMEEAVAFIQKRNLEYFRMQELMKLLQIKGRYLTAAEERYAVKWLEMGFDFEAISMAYERTCLNTGGLNWAYMNKILQRWHEAGLHTAETVRNGDRKPGSPAAVGQRQLDADEIAAIQRMMREE